MAISKIAAGLFRSVPLAAIEITAQKILDCVFARHPNLLARLGTHAEKTFAILPTDLPFVFLVHPASRKLMAYRSYTPGTSAVIISGSIGLLLALLEGRADGDAEFFGRKMIFSGDTEAVLALRNTLDDADLDLPCDIASQCGPLGPFVVAFGKAIRARAVRQETVGWS